MKPLYCALAASVTFALLTVPALQARADEDAPPTPSSAWRQGYTDGAKCVADGASCKFTNPYATKTDESGKSIDTREANTLALDNSDYIAGFIVGKTSSTSK
ncbi:hypothetical protein [Stenomitos frigidus]|uniref:Porin n=1 Tax=Stenomitos frigidus ULC18 TaxID=2107698 RepID=A0A2T1E4V0_9CYAN|nr:hypothetical protein [Stenomitos frigidus]PSB27751.1 hypothetical protein C7B82_15295 [Stenomitos frigidus ULC18]